MAFFPLFFVKLYVKTATTTFVKAVIRDVIVAVSTVCVRNTKPYMKHIEAVKIALASRSLLDTSIDLFTIVNALSRI